MSKRTDKIVMSNEARVLRQMRESSGLSMREAGKLIDRSDSFISQLENGRMPLPREALLKKILDAYGGGIKVKSFFEKARLLRLERTNRDELQELVGRLRDEQVPTALAVVKSLIS